jgi:hypothetical protein
MVHRLERNGADSPVQFYSAVCERWYEIHRHRLGFETLENHPSKGHTTFPLPSGLTTPETNKFRPLNSYGLLGHIRPISSGPSQLWTAKSARLCYMESRKRENDCGRSLDKVSHLCYSPLHHFDFRLRTKRTGEMVFPVLPFSHCFKSTRDYFAIPKCPWAWPQHTDVEEVVWLVEELIGNFNNRAGLREQGRDSSYGHMVLGAVAWNVRNQDGKSQRSSKGGLVGSFSFSFGKTP